MSNYDNWLLADGTVRELFDALNVANTDRLIEIISQTADDIVENDVEVGF